MDEVRGEEEYGEDGGEGGRLVLHNPVGEYIGDRNDKNERHRRGYAKLPNGDMYMGCYYRGKRHGLGIYKYKNGNGARYGGDWNLGIKAGWGTMYFPDGSQYTGNWAQGMIHGWGVYVYPNGDEYEGWWYQGKRNGRGIYRTKKTGEKFVGNWVLGLRQGKGMIVRKQHKFIGNWYNDCPRGPGVFIFPDLACEQHGMYTMIRMVSESAGKYKDKGYHMLNIRADEPPKSPVDMEVEIRLNLRMEEEMMRAEDDAKGAGEGGEGDVRRLPPPGEPGVMKKPDPLEKTPEQLVEEKVWARMAEWIAKEMEKETKARLEVSPAWRASQITRLMTHPMDETVPPPPIPDPPCPYVEPEEELEGEQGDEGDQSCGEPDNEDAIALKLARTHAMGEPYTGSGVCQLSLARIKWPDDCPPELKNSTMSITSLDEFKNVVQSVMTQIEPLDMDAIIAANLHLFKGEGIGITDRWRECLGTESECLRLEMKDGPRKSQEARGSFRASLGDANMLDGGNTRASGGAASLRGSLGAADPRGSLGRGSVKDGPKPSSAGAQSEGITTDDQRMSSEAEYADVEEDDQQ